MHPKSEGLLESSSYVEEKIFGFRVISDFGERGCAMQAGKRQMLLLFEKGRSRSIHSPHDGNGELHVAFAIPASQLVSWEAWLAENGIPVEEKRNGIGTIVCVGGGECGGGYVVMGRRLCDLI